MMAAALNGFLHRVKCWLPGHKRTVTLSGQPYPWFRTQQVATVSGAALLLCVAGSVAWTVWDAHREVQAQAERSLQNIAYALDQDIARNVHLYDVTVQSTMAGLQVPGLAAASPELRHAALFNQMGQAQYMAAVLVLNERGDIAFDSESAVPRSANFADRDYFRAHQQQGDAGLSVSRPFQSRLNGAPAIAFSRRLDHGDGGFAGVAVAAVQLAYFQDLFSRLDLGKHGAVTLLRNDGIILARWPYDASAIGHDIGTNELFQQTLRAHAGILRGPAAVDGIKRVIAFRHVADLPLIISVGLAEDEILAPWRRKMVGIGIGLATMAGLAILLALALRRELHRRSQAERAAEKSAQGEMLSAEQAKRSAHDLWEALQRLNALFENSADALFVASLRQDGKFAYDAFNPQAERLTGLLADAVVGRTPDECLPPDAARSVLAHWQQCARECRPLRYSHVLDLSGAPHHWETLLVPVLDDAGYVCRLIGTSRDVTMRQQAEDALQDQNQALEVRVSEAMAEREAALVRAAHAERMQVLGQLAGGIAHDFNNVLQGVNGCAALIERRPADTVAVRRLARLVLETTGRGATVTRRLLAFSRRDELQAEPIEAGPLLEGLCEILSCTLGGMVRVHADVAAGLPPLLADKGQLETVLLNLATNARDAMPGGGTLTLAAAPEQITDGVNSAGRKSELPSGCYVRLSVSDTGTGMSAAVRARVTEPFFTTKPAGQGTGLGLAMANGFAEQSGGRLAIESQPGQGTTVTLWLPQATAVSEAANPVTVAPADGLQTAAFRVLIVDDDDIVREAMAECLEADYKVVAASSGAEAVALLDAGETVDVLVTDLTMPGMDGLRLIREAQIRRPGLPALLLTGYAGDVAALAVSGAVSGAFSLMRKPVTASQLGERVAALLTTPLTGRKGEAAYASQPRSKHPQI